MWSQSLADNFFVESKLCKYICFLWRQVCADKEVVCVFNQTCADMFSVEAELCNQFICGIRHVLYGVELV